MATSCHRTTKYRQNLKHTDPLKYQEYLLRQKERGKERREKVKCELEKENPDEDVVAKVEAAKSAARERYRRKRDQKKGVSVPNPIVLTVKTKSPPAACSGMDNSTVCEKHRTTMYRQSLKSTDPLKYQEYLLKQKQRGKERREKLKYELEKENPDAGILAKVEAAKKANRARQRRYYYDKKIGPGHPLKCHDYILQPELKGKGRKDELKEENLNPNAVTNVEKGKVAARERQRRYRAQKKAVSKSNSNVKSKTTCSETNTSAARGKDRRTIARRKLKIADPLKYQEYLSKQKQRAKERREKFKHELEKENPDPEVVAKIEAAKLAARERRQRIRDQKKAKPNLLLKSKLTRDSGTARNKDRTTIARQKLKSTDPLKYQEYLLKQKQRGKERRERLKSELEKETPDPDVVAKVEAAKLADRERHRRYRAQKKAAALQASNKHRTTIARQKLKHTDPLKYQEYLLKQKQRGKERRERLKQQEQENLSLYVAAFTEVS